MEGQMGQDHKVQSGADGRIRAVLLDYGEVLCQRPNLEALNAMAKVFGVDPTKFFALYGTSRDPYDQGVVTAEEYWEKFAQGIGAQVQGNIIERLRVLDTEMWSVTSPEMTEWVRLLKEAGMTTALLSNMQHDMSAYARKNFGWLKEFDHLFLSCEVGLVKPDPAIFHHCIARMGVAPEETLFVDDREGNVSSARAVGIKAIRFRTVEQLREELRGMAFEVLPPEATTRAPQQHCAEA
jgi:putative hydrolase of the HAD superfamily